MLELKWYTGLYAFFTRSSYNRTMLELKYKCFDAGTLGLLPYNRTMLELKLDWGICFSVSAYCL